MLRAVVALVSDTIAVRVGLLSVGHRRAIVFVVVDAVVVDVFVADVPLPVTVDVRLVGVPDVGTVVTDVSDLVSSIAFRVALVWIGVKRAVILKPEEKLIGSCNV